MTASKPPVPNVPLDEILIMPAAMELQPGKWYPVVKVTFPDGHQRQLADIKHSYSQADVREAARLLAEQVIAKMCEIAPDGYVQRPFQGPSAGTVH